MESTLPLSIEMHARGFTPQVQADNYVPTKGK